MKLSRRSCANFFGVLVDLESGTKFLVVILETMLDGVHESLDSEFRMKVPSSSCLRGF